MKITNVLLASVVVIILLGAVLLPFIIPDRADLDSMSYDDYIVAEGVDSVSGSLELVTVGGVSYIHAKDLGDGVIVYDNGKEKPVSVKKAKLDVVLQAGQSNATYTNADLTLAPAPIPGTGYYYGYENAPIEHIDYDSAGCAFRSLTASDGTAAIGDKAPGFAKEYYSLTGNKVYYIITGISAMSVINFTPGYSVWNHMVKVVNAAMAAIPMGYFEVQTLSYVWLQGEGDRATLVSDYVDRFLDMHDAILSGDLGVRFNHAFIVKVRTSVSFNGSAAQEILADDYGKTISITDLADSFTVSNGLMGSDNLHYSQLGNNEISKTTAHMIASYNGTMYVDESMDLSLLYVLPVLIIVALVLFLIGAVVIRRNY